MRTTADTLQTFYQAPTGRIACAMAVRRLSALWPDMAGHNVLGFGYAAPYLEPFRRSANRVVLCCPEEQGAIAHRSSRGVMACLSEETILPFSDAAFERVLLVHAVEESDDLSGLLEEVYRVTQPEGRVVVIAAGRAGLWSRAERLPFGAGRPFTKTQLRARLEKAGFQPTYSAGALYGPPIARLCTPRLARTFERLGETLWPAMSGLVLVEGRKRLYAEPGRVERSRVRAPVFGSGQTIANRSSTK